MRILTYKGNNYQKVERQGKGVQHLCIESNVFWVPRVTYKQEKRLSKLKFLKNHPYLTLFLLGAAP